MFCNKCGKEISEGLLCEECRPAEEVIVESAVPEINELTVAEAAAAPVEEAAAAEEITAGAAMASAEEDAAVAEQPAGAAELAADSLSDVQNSVAPVVLSDPDQTVVSEKKKVKKKWPKVLAVVLAALVALGALGGGAWWLVSSTNDPARIVEPVIERFADAVEQQDMEKILDSIFAGNSDMVIGLLSETTGGITVEEMQEGMFWGLDEYEDLEYELEYELLNTPVKVEGKALEELKSMLIEFFVSDVEEAWRVFVDFNIISNADELDPSGDLSEDLEYILDFDMEYYVYKADGEWGLIPVIAEII